MKKLIFNLRIYSWVDLIFLGYLAKFSLNKKLAFAASDWSFIIALICLWIFYQLILEYKHGYNERGKSSPYLALVFFLVPIIIGYLINPWSIIFIILSTLFVVLYLFKNNSPSLAKGSSIIRGLIQSSYFLFVITLFTEQLTTYSLLIGWQIFLLMVIRSLIGDIRDYKHNKEANKMTFTVSYGLGATNFIILLLTIIFSVISFQYFSLHLIWPLIIFTLTIFFFKNGYVLHQLAINTTTFIYLNYIAFFTGQNMLLFNLIYLGIFLNFIFYPLLARKSNSTFN